MKRFLALVLALVCFAGFASAESIFSNYSNEDLLVFLNNIRNELLLRSVKEDGKAFLFKTDDYQLYFTNNCYIDDDYLKVEVVFVNNTDHSLNVGKNACVVNGWETFCWSIREASAHSKVKDEFEFRLQDCEIKSVSDLETITLDLYAFIDGGFDQIQFGKSTVIFDGSSFAVVE